jgi:ferredoxin like protein
VLVVAALRFADCDTRYPVCNGAGVIRWTYPEGGDGAVFRHG